MLLKTSKFGTLEIDAEALLVFPDGIIGFESERHWVLLSESNSESVGWLQSVKSPERAFCVVTPNAFVENYILRISRDQLDALPWSREDNSLVLALVSCHDEQLTMNLKAPIVINLDRQIACQVVSSQDDPLRHPLPVKAVPLRKIA